MKWPQVGPKRASVTVVREEKEEEFNPCVDSPVWMKDFASGVHFTCHIRRQVKVSKSYVLAAKLSEFT